MKKVLKKILEIAKLYRRQELVGLIFTIFYTIAVFVSPIVSGYLIDEIIPSNSIDKLKEGILVFFIGCIFQPFFGYIKNSIFMNISEKMTILFREKMFNRVLDASIEFFENSQNGSIVSRISNDGRSVSEFITNFFVVFLKNIIQIVIILITILILSPEITLIVIGMYGGYFVVNWAISKKFKKLSKDIQQSYDNICIKINRSVKLINTIKSFNQEEKVKNEFKSIINKNYESNIRYRKLVMLLDSISNGVMITCLSIVYGLGSLKVMNGEITVGTVVAIGLYFQYLVQPVYELMNNNVSLNTISPILNRISEYTSLPSERNTNSFIKIESIKGIQLKDISFAYSNGSKALENINISFPEKGMIAIVGESGAGKSSLIKLISGFYGSYEGEILLNGTELRQYDVCDVRKAISIVAQDIELMSESIKNNIKMGKEVSDEKINEIITLLNLDETIEKLESKTDTIINERINLSGGEKQRISIARSLIKDSLIYIFDEPTAALDTINEKRIKEILEMLSKEKLVIVITHNLSLLNKSDYIYTIKQGRIVEEGEYKYLSKNDTYFSKLMTELLGNSVKV